VKKFWFLFLVVVSWFVYVDRLKIFVRDPMGAVTRNGNFEEGAQVYINYDNDVLLENDHLPRYLNIVQHGQPVGVPAPLNCLFSMLCLASGYPEPQIAPVTGAPAEAMTNKGVQFKDENGREVFVKLR
jgi:hypothetical protein